MPAGKTASAAPDKATLTLRGPATAAAGADIVLSGQLTLPGLLDHPGHHVHRGLRRRRTQRPELGEPHAARLRAGAGRLGGYYEQRRIGGTGHAVFHGSGTLTL